jgi:hypothetical protein
MRVETKTDLLTPISLALIIMLLSKENETVAFSCSLQRYLQQLKYGSMDKENVVHTHTHTHTHTVDYS